MSEWLALSPEPTLRVENPLPTVPATAEERFNLEWEAMRRTGRFGSPEINGFEAFATAADTYRQIGMAVPRNPFEVDFVGDRARLLDEWDRASGEARRRYPELAADFPDAPQVHRRADRRARDAYQAADQARQAGDGSVMPGTAAFLGQALSAMADPVQVATLPLGAPVRLAGGLAMQVLKTALIEGGIAAGTQAVTEMRAAPYRESIGLPGDFGSNVLAAGAGGALLGGGARALVAGWRMLRGSGGDLLEQDSARLLDAQLRAQAGNPSGPELGERHLDTLDHAAATAAEGRLPAATQPPPVRRLADWIEQPEAPRVMDRALDLVRRAWSGSPPARPTGVSYGFLSADEAANLAANADLAVSTHTARILSSDRARHVLLNHGPGYEQMPGQLPVTEADLAQWPHLASQAAETIPTITNDNLAGAMHLVRRPDGSVVIIEEYRRRPNMLALSTMYRFTPEQAPENLRQISGVEARLRRREQSPSMAPAQRADRGPTSETTEGLRGNIVADLGRFNTFTPAGRAVLVEPQLVELADLIASHAPDGRLNPAYPHAEGVQPRDRAAAPSRDQVREIAAQLHPERLGPNAEAGHGAPIVAADNVVESGNGRVLALSQVYRRGVLSGQRDAYREWLAAQGFDLGDMREPVLVSRRISALTAEERRAFVREANSRGTLAQGAAELARADAARAGDALHLLQDGDLDKVKNAAFVRRFLEQLTASERGNMLTSNGQLSAEGQRRIQNAILARAYGEELGPLLERFLEGQVNGMRNIAGALADVAPNWARMREAVAKGLVAPEMDITADLTLAVRTLDDARRRGFSVADLVLQSDLDAPPLPDTARALLAGMHTEPQLRGDILSRPRLAAQWQGFLDEAMQRQAGPDLFGAPPDAAQTLAGAERRADRDVPRITGEEEPATFSFEPAASPPRDPLPETRAAVLASSRADEAMRAAPRVEDATLLEARRIAAARDIAVPMEAEAAGDVAAEGLATRGARDLLDEAEDQVSAAAEAAICLTGKAQ